MDNNVIVLIIDDKPANIFALQELLEKQGRVFMSATNGVEGLKIALNNSIDLIILDVQMPEMDGFEVAQILKLNKKTSDVPIIFASAEKKELQSVLKGFEEGAVDYLSKPLDPEVTKAKVSGFLKIQMQKRELIEKNISLENAEKKIKQLNADLVKNLDQLEVVNHELESFSYSVSHDLQAPVRSQLGYSKILEEDYFDKLDDEGRRLVKIIQRNAQRMNVLIADLLMLSRLGKKELQKADVDTGSMVESIISELTGGNNEKVSILVHKMLPTRADFSLLRQVWINLLSNALKYSSKKDKQYIELGCSEADREITFFVKDNGAGFSMDYASKLFGVFQRLHKESEFEGTGVGLATVKRIVNKHGGRVWAEAVAGEGATFYFTIPKG